MRVSFDFDATLCYDFLKAPNKKVIEKMKEHDAAGDYIMIVTTRMDKDMPEIHEFIKKHDLPVKEVHNTNFTWKRNTLKRLKVDMHYDDNPEEYHRVRCSCIRFILVDEYGGMQQLTSRRQVRSRQ